MKDGVRAGFSDDGGAPSAECREMFEHCGSDVTGGSYRRDVPSTGSMQ